MPDPREQIAGELDRLETEGTVLLVCAEIIARPEEERAKIAKEVKGLEQTLEDSEDRAQKAGKPALAEAYAASGLSALKIVDSKDFGGAYQRWYSQALPVVEQLLPDRYNEFRELYRPDKQPKVLNVTTYTISDYIHGTVAPGRGLNAEESRSVALGKFKNQIDILSSAQARLGSRLADIEGTLEATLLDDELDTANELLRTKHVRSAGVVAGVVLERHLKTVADNHEVKLGRKKAQIGSLNDALKEARVFDNPRWREVQLLADIRNLCAHDGEREPKQKEVRELIESTERIIKTVF